MSLLFMIYGDQMHRRAFHLQATSEAVLASLQSFSWHFWRLDRHLC